MIKRTSRLRWSHILRTVCKPLSVRYEMLGKVLKKKGRAIMENKDWKFQTRSIHCEVNPCKETGAVSQHLVPAVAYAFDTADDAVEVVNGEKDGVFYGLYGNPTTRPLENKIANLEESEDALGVSSGMAAISIAILAYVKQGEHIVVTKDVYGGTHKFLSNFGMRMGIEFDYVDCTEPQAIKEAIR